MSPRPNRSSDTGRHAASISASRRTAVPPYRRIIIRDAAILEIDVRSTPPTEPFHAEFGAIVMPARVLLIAQVSTPSPLLELGDDARIWMRWAEPEAASVEDARLEIAVSTARDEQTRTARVAARATITDRTLAWPICRFMEIQGLTDLFVGAPTAPDGAPSEFVHLLQCADLSRRSARYGLSVDHFPSNYV